jgi:hypothetical protein
MIKVRVLLVQHTADKMNGTPRLIPLTLTSTAGTASPAPGLFAAQPSQLQLQTRSPLNIPDYECALSSLDVTYSWGNIASQYGNTVISYIWVDGTTYNAAIPAPGGYEISDLNQIMQNQMEANGHFLVSTIEGVSTNVYYLSFAFNPCYLTTTITANAVPTSLTGTSLTNPYNVPLTSKCPRLVVTAGLGAILGFAAGTYPASAQTTTQIINGTLPSLLNPVTQVNITTNLVDVPSYSSNGSAIYTFVPGSGYGTLLSMRPSERVYFPVTTPQLSNVTVTLSDQNGNPLPMLAGLPTTVTLYLRRSF